MAMHRGGILTIILAVLGMLAPAPSPGAEPAFPDLFDATAARRPRPGEWVEYLVAFRVDPLENSLANPPLPGIDGVDPATLDPLLPLPSFEPPEAWRALPLRLEIIDMDDIGLRARLRFADQEREVAIPLARPDPTALFHYPDPQPEPEQGTQRIDGISYEVTVERRLGDSFGFARAISPELPFGLTRFATGDVDLILVGAGSGLPPAFPMPVRDPVSPPPGLFYREDG